jgi:hypothetical protein
VFGCKWYNCHDGYPAVQHTSNSRIKESTYMQSWSTFVASVFMHAPDIDMGTVFM